MRERLEGSSSVKSPDPSIEISSLLQSGFGIEETRRFDEIRDKCGERHCCVTSAGDNGVYGTGGKQSGKEHGADGFRTGDRRAYARWQGGEFQRNSVCRRTRRQTALD